MGQEGAMTQNLFGQAYLAVLCGASAMSPVALLPKLMSGEIRTANDEVRSPNCEKQDGRGTNDERRTAKRER